MATAGSFILKTTDRLSASAKEKRSMESLRSAAAIFPGRSLNP